MPSIEFGPTAEHDEPRFNSVASIIEHARKYSGSYILTQPALDALDQIILTTEDGIDDPVLIAAWDEVAGIVQAAKVANLGPNVTVGR